jgi:isocitrate/isopropylmalate dehydrogenase
MEVFLKLYTLLMLGKYEVTLIPGDGIGQETARAVKTLFKYENVPIDFEEVDVHGIGDEPGARELFNQSIESLKRNRVGLKGTSALKPINIRYLVYSFGKIRPSKLECGITSRIRYLRQCHPHQKHPRL